MVTKELLDELHKLDRTEKLRVVQLLVNELATQEAPLPLLEGTYPVYTPLGSEAAADVLYGMLQAAEAEGRAPTRG
jgi:hypothetical protein